MDMEHEIKKDAPSAQQAAGSIADDPQYKRMLWNVAQDWTRTDRHIALACYIERWADSRAAATPAQPIAVSAPTDEQVEASLVVYMAAWTDHDSMSQCKRNGIRAVLEFAARAAAPVSGPSEIERLTMELQNQREITQHWKAQAGYRAAPVSGQGDSAALIVRDVAALYYDGKFNPKKLMVVSPEDLTRIVERHIDSRPRSEDSRTKVLADALAITRKALEQLEGGALNVAGNANLRGDNYDFGYANAMAACARQALVATEALASTTPQKEG